ncbi:adenosylcobinamide-GDP ribazoletransferase [Sphingomonas endophytica]|uniref:Adenosylcobinamide-GDP ribazoletransferase n=1 Tax=Sphingomonas endophytica TaxID=869719 RepID=A0A7X0JCT6_9SPHN|nr:adenosylcobinamide-GDP ribazoletransferase [Sphingomonas endophytica]MBB6504442.1 adenosylcobinamide-GDP ribazoletransferase [Sphingomonas endophytica]
MTRLWLAFAFLTRLPVPRTAGTQQDFAAAIRCYPLVGAVIGALVAGVAWLGARHDPWTGALAGLVVWVAVTGALHLDGLGDVADGVGAAHGDRTRLLAVMRDPHVGSFAVVAIALQLIAKLVLLHALAGDWRVALIPFAARIAPLAWARWLPPLGNGLGAQVASAVRARDLTGWIALLALAIVAAPPLLAAPLVVAAYGLWCRHRLGGVNGDAHGAGIELVESALLAALLCG